MSPLTVRLALIAIVNAALAAAACTGSISSLDDVAEAVKCTTVNINTFLVPAGQTFDLNLLTGTTVNMLGDVSFGNETWVGPLFQVSGRDIIFNGNGHAFNGNGPFYWDGLGGNGGVTKPAPMMKIKISGIYKNVKVINSPARTYSVSNPAPLTMTDLEIDNSLGDQPNANSAGKAAGHNTDGFDCSTRNLVIQDSIIWNQDDCLAINKGNNITFQRNSCTGGHGISVGSISTDAVVQGIYITDNTIIDNDQALRIKTKADATNASVTDVFFSGNTATGTKKYGVIIDQSYPSTIGTPGNNVTISNIQFSGEMNTISVASSAQRVAVNCGTDSCTGQWDWSQLTVTGGKAGKITNFNDITGWTNS